MQPHLAGSADTQKKVTLSSGRGPGRGDAGGRATPQSLHCETPALPPVSDSPLKRRRALRQTATPAERRLWQIVRGRRLAHLKIRRQHSIGPFIVDFYCHEVRLAVEIDGRVHDDPARAAYDARRQRCIEAQGVHVLRFTNDEVRRQSDVVAEAIRHVAEDRAMGVAPALPGPLPGEREVRSRCRRYWRV